MSKELRDGLLILGAVVAVYLVWNAMHSSSPSAGAAQSVPVNESSLTVYTTNEDGDYAGDDTPYGLMPSLYSVAQTAMATGLIS